jgi:GNAT superfamily N-acetyltransferase
MSFSIEPYNRDYLEGMVALYNAETAFEPHIAPLTPERFLALVERKSCFEPAGLLVAVGNGVVVGWVHACRAPGSEGPHDPGQRILRLRMLIYPRERLKVGAALVAAATEWLRGFGNGEIEALHARAGYPFYRGLWLGGEPMGPVSMPHVQLALEVGGFKNTQESIFMTAAMPRAPDEQRAAVPLEFVESATEMRHEGMRESWTGFEPQRIRALLADEEVGSIGWVLLPHLDRLGAPCLNIWSLGVREAHRRQGVASALVGRAMALGYALGARFASVGTQLWNAPAHATYARFGFRPHCVMVGRTRAPGPADEVI